MESNNNNNLLLILFGLFVLGVFLYHVDSQYDLKKDGQHSPFEEKVHQVSNRLKRLFHIKTAAEIEQIKKNIDIGEKNIVILTKKIKECEKKIESLQKRIAKNKNNTDVEYVKYDMSEQIRRCEEIFLLYNGEIDPYGRNASVPKNEEVKNKLFNNFMSKYEQYLSKQRVILKKHEEKESKLKKEKNDLKDKIKEMETILETGVKDGGFFGGGMKAITEEERQSCENNLKKHEKKLLDVEKELASEQTEIETISGHIKKMEQDFKEFCRNLKEYREQTGAMGNYDKSIASLERQVTEIQEKKEELENKLQKTKELIALYKKELE